MPLNLFKTFMFSLRAFSSLQISVVSSANWLILASTDCGSFIP